MDVAPLARKPLGPTVERGQTDDSLRVERENRCRIQIVALPLVAIIPFIGPGTALSFGISVGAGVLAGSRDVRGRLSGY